MTTDPTVEAVRRQLRETAAAWRDELEARLIPPYAPSIVLPHPA